MIESNVYLCKCLNPNPSSIFYRLLYNWNMNNNLNQIIFSSPILILLFNSFKNGFTLYHSSND